MAFFMLFNVPKEFEYNQLKKELSNYGTINFLKLNDDIKNKDFKFGQLDYSVITKKNDLLSFLKSKKINAKEKESKQSNDINQLKPMTISYESKPPQPNNATTTTIANPSFHFYKDKAYGKGIENFQLVQNYQNIFEIDGAETFTLTTIYPGLLVGSGYNHPKLKESNEDFQLGFFFDHTTGLPIISGSSIKGLLKSVCEKTDFMQDVYGKIVSLDIFEDGETIFYDAYIVETKNKGNKIFGSDYITSHYSNEENGMFKELKPVKFLKVLPDVTFKFQFKAPKEYVELFKAIILDFGLGAKTNVGYGKFIE